MAKILIVDDDPGIAVVASALLTAEGHEVETLESARDAAARLRRADVDLAIVDFDVAKREGLDLAEAITSTPALDETALIGVAFDVQQIPLELVDLAVQKPYATEELGAIVRRVLQDEG